MNREFVVKMMQAKKLEYEAFKEILPEKMVNKISTLESDIIDIMKECIMSGYTGYETNKRKSEEPTAKKLKKIVIES